jgi:hypothetical protein
MWASTVLSMDIFGIMGVVANTLLQTGQPAFLCFATHCQPQSPQKLCPHGLKECVATLLDADECGQRRKSRKPTKYHNICERR